MDQWLNLICEGHVGARPTAHFVLFINIYFWIDYCLTRYPIKFPQLPPYVSQSYDTAHIHGETHDDRSSTISIKRITLVIPQGLSCNAFNFRAGILFTSANFVPAVSVIRCFSFDIFSRWIFFFSLLCLCFIHYIKIRSA